MFAVIVELTLVARTLWCTSYCDGRERENNQIWEHNRNATQTCHCSPRRQWFTAFPFSLKWPEAIMWLPGPNINIDLNRFRKAILCSKMGPWCLNTQVVLRSIWACCSSAVSQWSPTIFNPQSLLMSEYKRCFFTASTYEHKYDESMLCQQW